VTLGERAEIVAAVWPPSHIGLVLLRCVLVYDVETGYPTPMLSPREEARVREEIASRAPVTIDLNLARA